MCSNKSWFLHFCVFLKIKLWSNKSLWRLSSSSNSLISDNFLKHLMLLHVYKHFMSMQHQNIILYIKKHSQYHRRKNCALHLYMYTSHTYQRQQTPPQISHPLSCWPRLTDILMLWNSIMQHCSCPTDQRRTFWMWAQPPHPHRNLQRPTRRRTCEGMDESHVQQTVEACCNWLAVDPGRGLMGSLGERCTRGGTVLPQSMDGLKREEK